jgi:Tfp pilus assembly protein PilN
MSLKDSIMNKITRSNIASGIQINLGEDGLNKMSLCVLHKKKNIIENEFVINDIQDYKLIKKHLAADTPVILTVIGKGIIHKKVSHNAGDDEKVLFQKAFPNTKREEFYIQKTAIDPGHSFLSFVRRDIANAILNECNVNGIDVTGFYLGPFTVNNITPLLTDSEASIVNVGAVSLTIKNGHIETIQPSSGEIVLKQLKVGEEVISPENIIPYSNAIGYFINNNQLFVSDIQSVKNSEKEFEQKKLFFALGKASLMFFILALLSNYVFFNHYYSEKNILSAKISSQLDEINQYDTLKQSLAKKKAFLSNSGFLTESKTSFYADRLAATVPDDILLDDMDINPLIKKSEADTSTTKNFALGTIVVSGTTKNSIDVGDWMKLIKENQWVKSAELLSYNQDKELNQGRFRIMITLK